MTWQVAKKSLHLKRDYATRDHEKKTQDDLNFTELKINFSGFSSRQWNVLLCITGVTGLGRINATCPC